MWSIPLIATFENAGRIFVEIDDHYVAMSTTPKQSTALQFHTTGIQPTPKIELPAQKYTKRQVPKSTAQFNLRK